MTEGLIHTVPLPHLNLKQVVNQVDGCQEAQREKRSGSAHGGKGVGVGVMEEEEDGPPPDEGPAKANEQS